MSAGSLAPLVLAHPELLVAALPQVRAGAECSAGGRAAAGSGRCCVCCWQPRYRGFGQVLSVLLVAALPQARAMPCFLLALRCRRRRVVPCGERIFSAQPEPHLSPALAPPLTAQLESKLTTLRNTTGLTGEGAVEMLTPWLFGL